MNRFIIQTIAVATTLACCQAAVDAAPITVSGGYQVNTAIPPASTDFGLSPGDLVPWSATFDDGILLPDAGGSTAELSGAPGESFSLVFGLFTFGIADDLFGGPVVRIGTGGGSFIFFSTEKAVGLQTYSIEFDSGFLVPEFRVTLVPGPEVNLQGTPVPEPGSMVLLGTGLLSLGLRRWNKKGVPRSRRLQ